MSSVAMAPAIGTTSSFWTDCTKLDDSGELALSIQSQEDIASVVVIEVVDSVYCILPSQFSREMSEVKIFLIVD